MRDQQGFADFASARAGDLRRQAYLLTGSPERAARLADRALADTARRWDKLGGVVAAEEHARRIVATGALRGRGVAPVVALTPQGTAAPTDDPSEAVRRALAGLPPRRRAVLVLRYDEGLDDTAVGARLGFPAAAAAAEGEAGLATLRSLLRRRGRPEDLLPTALAQIAVPTALIPPPSPRGQAAAPGRGGATPAEPDGSAAPAPAPPDGPTATGRPSPGGAGTASTAAAAQASTAAAAPVPASTVDQDGRVSTGGAGAAPASSGGQDGRVSTGGAGAVPASSGGSAGPASSGDAAGVPASTGGSAGAALNGPGADRAAGATVSGEGAARGETAGRGSADGRRRWAVAAAVVVAAGIVAAVLAPALRDDSAGAGPVPAAAGGGPGQLAWPARGPLAGDQDLLRSALRAWQRGVPDRQRPDRVAALWAGDIDGVRTTVLQGTDASGQSWAAQVVGSGDTASLRSTEPLGRAVPLLALGTSAGAVRLLPPPDAAPDGVLAAVGTEMRPLAVAGDGLTQGVTTPSTGLRVALTDAGAVVGSGTVLPGRLSPVTGPVELTRATLDLGPAQPVAPVWYDDGQLIARRLPAAVGLVQVGPTRAATLRVGARRARLEARAYEVVRGGSRYLASVVRADGTPVCTDAVGVGPADAAPARPVTLVARCIPRGSADGVLLAVGTRGVRSVQVTVAPAVPGTPARPGRPARSGRPARTATIAGSSGAGLVGLTAVAGLPTRPIAAVVRDGAGHAVARLALAPDRGQHP